MRESLKKFTSKVVYFEKLFKNSWEAIGGKWGCFACTTIHFLGWNMMSSYSKHMSPIFYFTIFLSLDSNSHKHNLSNKCRPLLVDLIHNWNGLYDTFQLTAVCREDNGNFRRCHFTKKWLSYMHILGAPEGNYVWNWMGTWHRKQIDW